MLQGFQKKVSGKLVKKSGRLKHLLKNREELGDVVVKGLVLAAVTAVFPGTLVVEDIHQIQAVYHQVPIAVGAVFEELTGVFVRSDH